MIAAGFKTRDRCKSRHRKASRIEALEFSEIREAFVAVSPEKQGLGRRSFGEDDFMGFEQNVEILDYLSVPRSGRRDGAPIDKIFNENEVAIDEQGVTRGEIEVPVRRPVIQRVSRNTDRHYLGIPE
jgi:hypothetical protein